MASRVSRDSAFQHGLMTHGDVIGSESRPSPRTFVFTPHVSRGMRIVFSIRDNELCDDGNQFSPRKNLCGSVRVRAGPGPGLMPHRPRTESAQSYWPAAQLGLVPRCNHHHIWCTERSLTFCHGRSSKPASTITAPYTLRAPDRRPSSIRQHKVEVTSLVKTAMSPSGPLDQSLMRRRPPSSLTYAR